MKISQLTPLTEITGTENLVVEAAGDNNKVSTGVLLNDAKPFLIKIQNISVPFSALEKAVNDDKILIYEDDDGIYPVVMAKIITPGLYIDITTVSAEYNWGVSVTERRLSNDNGRIKIGGTIVKSLVDESKVVNNSTTIYAGYVLDARQGNVLRNLIDGKVAFYSVEISALMGDTITTVLYTGIKNAIISGNPILIKDTNNCYICTQADVFPDDSGHIDLSVCVPTALESGATMLFVTFNIRNINDVLTISHWDRSLQLIFNGDGTKFLSDDGYYKTVSSGGEGVTFIDIEFSFVSSAGAYLNRLASPSYAELAGIVSSEKFLVIRFKDPYNSTQYLFPVSSVKVRNPGASAIYDFYTIGQLPSSATKDSGIPLVMKVFSVANGYVDIDGLDGTQEAIQPDITLITKGTGNKFLADNGVYKEISAGESDDQALVVYVNVQSGSSAPIITIPSGTYNKIDDAVKKRKSIFVSWVNPDNGYYEIFPVQDVVKDTSGSVGVYNLYTANIYATVTLSVYKGAKRINNQIFAINANDSLDMNSSDLTLEMTGNGTKFLANDGSYKTINSLSSEDKADFDHLLQNGYATGQFTKGTPPVGSNRDGYDLNLKMRIPIDQTENDSIVNIPLAGSSEVGLMSTEQYSWLDEVMARADKETLCNIKDLLTTINNRLDALEAK